MTKKIFKTILLVTMAFCLGGCSNFNSVKKVGDQLNPPSNYEEIAVITTNMGVIKMRLFPNIAPKAVENFKTHAKDGYYNGVIFHRIIKNFISQTGDPLGNGTGGTSIWNGTFEDEFSDKLFNINGSVSMANAGPDTNGSQFFFNTVPTSNFRGWKNFQNIYDMYKEDHDGFNERYGGTVDMEKVTDEIKSLYETNSGNPNLDGFLATSGKGHTVFGQVFEGLDVLEAISKVETDNTSKPITDVIIEKIEISQYK